MARMWYYRHNGQEHGPYNGSELRNLVTNGIITSQTEVKSTDRNVWTSAAKIKGLLPGSGTTSNGAQAAWYVRNGDGTNVGPLTRHQLEEMYLHETIDSESKIRHIRWQDWRPAAELFPDLASIDARWSEYLGRVRRVSGAAASVFSKLRELLRFDWTPEVPHLRRCAKCHWSQFTSPKYCERCGNPTVGLHIAEAGCGRDLAEQKIAEFAAGRRRRLITTSVACFSTAFVLFVAAIVTFKSSFMLLILLLLVTPVSPLVVTAIRNRLFLSATSYRGNAVASDDVIRKAVAQYLGPFLQRCESLADAGRGSGIELLRTKSFGDVSAFSVFVVPDDELEMLEGVLEQNHCRLWNCWDGAERVLKSTALFLDYSQFEDRVNKLRQSGNDVFIAFATLIKDADDRIPFLQELLLRESREYELTEIWEELAFARQQLRVKGFARDLEQRRTGGMSITMEMIDGMDPYKFELLLGMMYEAKGYAVEETPKSGDQGADVLVELAGERTVIQAKRYSNTVGNKAVQEAIAARGHFRCHFAAVVTNNYFTPSAQDLARTNEVKLIDRDQLSEMLVEFNRIGKDYSRLLEILRPA